MCPVLLLTGWLSGEKWFPSLLKRLVGLASCTLDLLSVKCPHFVLVAHPSTSVSWDQQRVNQTSPSHHLCYLQAFLRTTWFSSMKVKMRRESWEVKTRAMVVKRNLLQKKLYKRQSFIVQTSHQWRSVLGSTELGYLASGTSPHMTQLVHGVVRY